MPEVTPDLPVDDLALPTRPWVAIVGNPYSGRGVNRRAATSLAEALEKRSLPTLTVWDREQRRALFAHPHLARWCCCVVVAGGDGTVGEVMGEQPAVPLAVLPLGNENLLAREFGFTAGYEALVEAILRGQHRPLDLGCLGDRRFSLMLSAGLDAEIVRRVALWRHHGGGTRRVGHISYMRPTLATLAYYDFPRITLAADGEMHTGALVMVFNLPRYGLGLPFAPHARGDDGELDWIVFEQPGRVMALRYGLDVWRGRHLSRANVRIGRARTLTLTSDRPAPMQVDGDFCGMTPATVTVQPQAVRVIAMQPAAEAG